MGRNTSLSQYSLEGIIYPLERRRMKYTIKIKDGRAYLHSDQKRTKIFKYGYSSVLPLGNNPKIINEMIDEYKCKVVFLD